MQHLQQDGRGYPVPYVVLWDKSGVPQFTINETGRQLECIFDRKCPICGTPLESKSWVVGGPFSAFDPEGAYTDSAMHTECMTYAMRVCPYLAAPKYVGRIDDAKIKPGAAPDGVLLVKEISNMADRPRVFVAVCARKYAIHSHEYGANVKPLRPYVAVQFWRQGERLSTAEGQRIANEALIKTPRRSGKSTAILAPR
jgi:hypothetical protein